MNTLIAIVVAGLFAALGVMDLGTRHKLQSTRTTLAGSRRNLASTKGQLANTQADLAQMTSERNNLRSQLDAKNTELAGVRGSLTDAQQRVTLQAGQIGDLKACLSGVAQSASDLAGGDINGAVGALDAVTPICQRANSEL